MLFTPLVLRSMAEVDGSVITGFAKRLAAFKYEAKITYKESQLLTEDWKRALIGKYYKYQPIAVAMNKTALDE